MLLVVPIPDIHNDDSKARLWEVTDTTQKMWVALGSTIGTLWYNELELRRNLDSVLALLQMAPGQMTNWLFSAAFEGAHQVLAGVRAHHPAMDLRPLVRVVPGDQNLEAFFEEVSEDAEFAAGAYEPQTIVKRAPKDVDGSS